MNLSILRHIGFWIATVAILTIYFGRESSDYIQAFFFTTFLLPVALATTYFFNYYLLPKYLLTRAWSKFALYFFYTLIISLYLEMLVITSSFIILANYQYEQMNPLTVDLFTLTITVYLIVIIIAFVRMFKTFQQLSGEKKELIKEQEKMSLKHLTIRSERKEIPIAIDQILYVESLADYIKVHTQSESIISKEKISKIQEVLPSNFIRVHRSFIINKNKIESFNKDALKVQGQSIPISRTYKKETFRLLDETSLNLN